jgi:hypothetical protein
VLISFNFVESFFLFLGEVTFLFILVLLLEFGLFLLLFFILKYKTGNLIRTFDFPFQKLGLTVASIIAVKVQKKLLHRPYKMPPLALFCPSPDLNSS